MLLLAIPHFFYCIFGRLSSFQVESVVGSSSLPQIFTEPEHLKHIDARVNRQEQYRAKATQNILCAQTRQKLHYD